MSTEVVLLWAAGNPETIGSLYIYILEEFLDIVAQKNSKLWYFGIPNSGGSSAVLRGLDTEGRASSRLNSTLYSGSLHSHFWHGAT